MADVAADSNNATQIKITIDSGKSDEENQNSASGDENHSNETEKESNEKNSSCEASNTAKLFLRPSALSRDGLKSSSTPSNSAPLTIFNSYKFSNHTDDTDSLFNLHSTADKLEPKSTITTPIRPVSVSLANPDYVFGQNLGGRVVESVSNGTGSMLFSSVLNAEIKKKDGPESEVESSEASTASLLEDAARCQEQRAAKRKYDEVQVTTGEENEKNILQISVKLFAFESGSWVERGRGTLRLNDVENSGSRIVIRTMGSLRVVLNTKIWPGMELSRASEKSIRTTAMDSLGVLKIFLIQASAADTTLLFDHMQERIRRCESTPSAECASETESSKPDSEDAEESPTSAKVAAIEEKS